MQHGSFWRQASTFQTVSWGRERTSAGVQKAQYQNLPVLVGSLVLRRAPSVVYVVKLFLPAVSLSVSAQLLLWVHQFFLPSQSLMEVWRTWRNQFVAELSFSTFRQHLGASKRSCPAGDGLFTRLHCFIATTWLGSNTTPCLLSKCPYLDHKMESFVPKNKLCLCRGAITSCAICDSSSPTSGYRDAIQRLSSAG